MKSVSKMVCMVLAGSLSGCACGPLYSDSGADAALTPNMVRLVVYRPLETVGYLDSLPLSIDGKPFVSLPSNEFAETILPAGAHTIATETLTLSPGTNYIRLTHKASPFPASANLTQSGAGFFLAMFTQSSPDQFVSTIVDAPTAKHDLAGMHMATHSTHPVQQ